MRGKRQRPISPWAAASLKRDKATKGEMKRHTCVWGREYAANGPLILVGEAAVWQMGG